MLRTIGMAAAVAASVGLAVPAEAQWRGGRPYRHHRDRIDGGDLLLGALLAGGVIAIASAASNADRQRRAAPPAEPLPREWADPDGPDGSFDGADRADDDAAPVAANDEDVAADTCAEAAEEEGRRIARRATVSAVTDVDRAGQGWFVAGTIALADGYRDAATERRFRCNLTVGEAPNVRIDGGVMAQR
jgi:hypothetical protein